MFGQVGQVIDVSDNFSRILENAASQGLMGGAFLYQLKSMEHVYCEYCKNNEASLNKLAEYAAQGPPKAKAFLEEAKLKLQGRTGAWDLGSLIVKPVQRVLKYPLLIKSLLKETDPSHPDFTDLTEAYEKMELVAEKINQVKKRKDIVEKYVEGKGSLNVMHGISKKWSRGAQILKKNMGLSEESLGDALYDALLERFDEFQTHIQSFIKNVSLWSTCIQEHFQSEEMFAGALVDLYTSEKSSGFNREIVMVQQYKSACSSLINGPGKTAVI